MPLFNGSKIVQRIKIDFTYGWRPHHTQALDIKMGMQMEATKLLCEIYRRKKPLA